MLEDRPSDVPRTPFENFSDTAHACRALLEQRAELVHVDVVEFAREFSPLVQEPRGRPHDGIRNAGLCRFEACEPSGQVRVDAALELSAHGQDEPCVVSGIMRGPLEREAETACSLMSCPR